MTTLPPSLPSSDLRCVRCDGTGLSPKAEALECPACGAGYPTSNGVPLLVADWKAHEAEMVAARDTSPDWYVAEQPAEAASPWRHHLRKRRLYVSSVIQRHLKARGLAQVDRLLDLGCGDGSNLAWLSPFARTVYGSDYNLARLTRAGHRVPSARLFLADILNYPWQNDSFDIIFFNHVIEHIPDDRAALENVRRLLRPGGLLVLGTPNEGAWWWQLAYRRAPETLSTTDHVHFYTAKTIGDRMSRAGLAVNEVKHMGWGPPDWRLDGQIRQYKWVDDTFEILGRIFIPRQASSLYLIASKP